MGTDPRMLVVEDDLALQPFWELFFRRTYGRFSLDWAISGEEARRLIHQAHEEKRPYTVIVTDLFLAGAETGLDLIESSEVKDSHATIILVSSIESEKIQHHYKQITGDHLVISKPLNLHKCERLFSARREIA